MSDDSDPGLPPKNHRSKRKFVVTSSSSDSDTSLSDIVVQKNSGKRKNRIRDSDSDSDSSVEKPRKIRRVPVSFKCNERCIKRY